MADHTKEERDAYLRDKAAAKRDGTPMPDFETYLNLKRGDDFDAAPAEEAVPVVEGRPWDEAEFPAPEEEIEDELDVVELAEPEMESEPALDRETYLSRLDDEVKAKLNDEDIDILIAEERARASAEAKQKAMTRAREQIRQHMRVEQGLLDSAALRTLEQRARLKKTVRIKFNLPHEGVFNPQFPSGIRMDGRLYEVNRWYTVSIAEYESIASMHYDVWVNELQFKTLDQASSIGITNMNQLRGTTPAKVIMARAPHQIEVQDVDQIH